jgi:endoribonuclease LACTB2
VLSAGTSRLLVDLGRPGTLGNLLSNLQRNGIPLAELRYGLATHYHVDHAGLAQELKMMGVPLLVSAGQEYAIPLLKRWTKPEDHFRDITLHDNVVVRTEDSRKVLAGIGIGGEIVHTPGHSDDSITLLLDNGFAFTGDLPLPSLVTDENAAAVVYSWRELRTRGATTVYPGHGPARAMPPTGDG